MQFTERSFGTGWLVGQSSGFEACYAQAAPRLVAQLFYAFGDVEEARDCVQEAFARAWIRWDALTGEGDDPGRLDPHDRLEALAVSGWRRRARYLRALRRHGPTGTVPTATRRPDRSWELHATV